MTRTDTPATSTATSTATGTATTVLPPALATLVRTAPVARATAWEPTTLYVGVARRTALAGTVPLPGQALVGRRLVTAAAPKHLGRPVARATAADGRRDAPVWAVAALVAAVLTAAVGSLTGLLDGRPPAAPAGTSGGTSVSAPAAPGAPLGR